MVQHLILLPGMMCDARLFSPQIAALSSQYHLHIPYLGGHDSMMMLAQEVLQSAPPKFALAGLSMGGILAMEVYRQAPDRITHLGLLDTNPRAELPEIQALRGPQIESVKAGQLAEVMQTQMIPKYLADRQAGQVIEDLCLQMALDMGDACFLNQSLALRDRPDQQAVLQQVDIPTLILCGIEDQLCPLARHDLMASLIPSAIYEKIPRAGHISCLEQPDAVTIALKKWLESEK